jgi:hypothetical protein
LKTYLPGRTSVTPGARTANLKVPAEPTETVAASRSRARVDLHEHRDLDARGRRGAADRVAHRERVEADRDAGPRRRADDAAVTFPSRVGRSSSSTSATAQEVRSSTSTTTTPRTRRRRSGGSPKRTTPAGSRRVRTSTSDARFRLLRARSSGTRYPTPPRVARVAGARAVVLAPRIRRVPTLRALGGSDACRIRSRPQQDPRRPRWARGRNALGIQERPRAALGAPRRAALERRI